MVQHDDLISSVLEAPLAAVETFEADNMVDVSLVVAFAAAAFGAAFVAASAVGLAVALIAALVVAAASDGNYLMKSAFGFDADRPDKVVAAAAVVVDGIVAAEVVQTLATAKVPKVEIGLMMAVEAGIVVGVVTVVKVGIGPEAVVEVAIGPVVVGEAGIEQVKEWVHADVDTIVHALVVVDSQVVPEVKRNVAPGN